MKEIINHVEGILDNYDQGEYYLNGDLIQNMSEKKAAWYRNKMIGFVFQSFNLISFKNAMENVALPLYYQKISRKKRNLKAMEYLERLGLKDWALHLPNELSGGQKQRLAIARALISDPKVILADEPTGNLDSSHGDEVMKILVDLNENGTTIVMVTHSPAYADYANRVIHLFDGHIVTENLKEKYDRHMRPLSEVAV